MPGTLSPAAAGATSTTPLGHLDLQQDGCFPGTTASVRILSPTLPVLSISQTAARALPLREPLLGVSCRVQPTAPRWSQCDMKLPVHTGPQESTPTSTVDRGSSARAGLRGSGEGQAERPLRTAAPTRPTPALPSSLAEDTRMWTATCVHSHCGRRLAHPVCPPPEVRADHTPWVYPTPAVLDP